MHLRVTLQPLLSGPVEPDWKDLVCAMQVLVRWLTIVLLVQLMILVGIPHTTHPCCAVAFGKQLVF